MKLTSTIIASLVASVSAFGGASGTSEAAPWHFHKLADGSFVEHNFECEPDTTCLYPGMEGAPNDLEVHSMAHLASMKALGQARADLASTTDPSDDAAFESVLATFGITGNETPAQYLGGMDPSIVGTTTVNVPYGDQHSPMAHSDMYDAAGNLVWSSALRAGRRLLNSDPYDYAAFGGGATTYGGGGGSNTIYCPTGSYWAGWGDYCLNGDIWRCSYAGQPADYVVSNCGSRGCSLAAPGVKDTCNAARPECYYNSDCRFDQFCNNRGKCEYSPTSSYCYNNRDCGSNEYCASDGYCYANGGGSSNCWSYDVYFDGPYYDYAVKQQNTRIVDYIYTDYDCLKLCQCEDSFYCRTYEYNSYGAKCVLSTGTAPVISAKGWDVSFRGSQ